MIAFTAAEIAEITSGRLDADPGITPLSVVAESLEANQGSLYVAKPGEHADGHDFIDAAFAAGAVLALVGLVASAALLPTPRVHTLVYAAMLVIIGFQTIVFAAFTKIFAVNEGLLPPDRRLDRVFRVVTLEVGLSLGVVMVAAGIAGSLYALAVWEQTAFGALDASSLAMRIVIVSSSAIALGVQVILSSFFFSILGLRRRL